MNKKKIALVAVSVALGTGVALRRICREAKEKLESANKSVDKAMENLDATKNDLQDDLSTEHTEVILETLNLSKRGLKSLIDNGIYTVEDAMAYGIDDLEDLDNVGKKTVDKIKKVADKIKKAAGK